MLTLFRSKPSQVFYIRGYAKSGTNWLCNLMNLHPDVRCTGEFHLKALFDGFSQMREERWSFLNQAPSSDLLSNAFHHMIKTLIIEACGKAPWCGDRTPLPLRATLLPGVKHIYVTRDGRDVLVSWIYHSYNWDLASTEKQRENRRRFQADPYYFEEHKHELLECEEAVRSFGAEWNAQILDDFRMMAAADRGEIDLDYRWVRYEDLQVDTLGYRDQLLKYLGLDATRARPLTSETQPGFGDPNTNRPKEFFRRGLSGTWQEYFTALQLNWFEDEAREALELVAAK